jgi:putative oxidoreductase
MLKAILSPFADKTYAVLRIVSGLMFSFHGMQKIFGLLSKGAVSFSAMPQIWIGGLIELVAGLLIAAGLFTRCAAFVASGTMAVAYWQFHFIGNPNKVEGIARFLPGPNGGEMAALYCFLFLYLACKGAGVWSIDAKREAAAAGS